jgi:hypothetical protein
VQRVNLHLALGGNFADGNEAMAARQGCRDCGSDVPPPTEVPESGGDKLSNAEAKSASDSLAKAP